MERIEPVKPVHPVSYTKDSTSQQRSQTDTSSKEKTFRESIRKAAMAKRGKKLEDKKNTDTITISEEARKKYEQMQEEKEQLK